MNFIVVASLSIISSLAIAAKAPIKTVRIGLLEALESTNSTSSDRYTRAFEAAVFYAVGENEKELNRCGYKLQLERSYFEALDRSSPQKAAKDLKDKNIWIVFGPRRADDILLSLTELKNTPLVSPMANGYAVEKLKQPIFMMYEKIDRFSEIAVQTLKKERYGKRYGALIDPTFPSAIDFEKSFDVLAKNNGFQKYFSVDASGDEPELSNLMEELRKQPVDFLLLPNNSKLSGYVISKVQQEFPAIKFFGTSGWGDRHYGYLPKYGIHDTTKGFCIRVGRNFSAMSEDLEYGVSFWWDFPSVVKVVDRRC